MPINTEPLHVAPRSDVPTYILVVLRAQGRERRGIREGCFGCDVGGDAGFGFLRESLDVRAELIEGWAA